MSESSLFRVPMILYCPSCGVRHIDRGEFAEKPHHTHACQACGMVWRPAVVNTVGVQFLPGYKDERAAMSKTDKLIAAIERAEVLIETNKTNDPQNDHEVPAPMELKVQALINIVNDEAPGWWAGVLGYPRSKPDTPWEAFCNEVDRLAELAEHEANMEREIEKAEARRDAERETFMSIGRFTP